MNTNLHELLNPPLNIPPQPLCVYLNFSLAQLFPTFTVQGGLSLLVLFGLGFKILGVGCEFVDLVRVQDFAIAVNF